jgi:hypothetical protein
MTTFHQWNNMVIPYPKGIIMDKHEGIRTGLNMVNSIEGECIPFVFEYLLHCMQCVLSIEYITLFMIIDIVDMLQTIKIGTIHLENPNEIGQIYNTWSVPTVISKTCNNISIHKGV